MLKDTEKVKHDKGKKVNFKIKLNKLSSVLAKWLLLTRT